MRFHIGFSKRISFSSLLKIIGVLAAAILGYFGFTQNAYALTYNGTLQEVNTSFIDNGDSTESYDNISTFEYDNFYFANGRILKTDTYQLGFVTADYSTSWFTSYNINYYMSKPCSSSDNLSYTQRIRFYYVSGAKLDFNSIGVTLGNYGCTGYWNQIGDNWDYVLTCNMQPNSYVVGSLTFSNIPIIYNNVSSYRVAIQRNFDYQCSVNSQNIIENNNINTQNIINNQNNNTQQIIDSQSQTTDAVNELNDSITDSDTTDAVSSASDLFEDTDVSDPVGLTSIITAPIRLLQSLLNGGSCNSLDFTITLLGASPKQVSLPSGCILWDLAPGSVILLYHITIFGLFGYRVLIDMVHFIDNLRDPDHKNEYTLDL